MLSKLARHIEVSGIIRADDQILVAISGGPDSVFLAHGLQQLGYAIGLAHVNYHQRGETSEMEEKMVREMGETWGVPVHILSCNPKKLLEPGGPSFQMIARRQRYDFFDSLLKKETYTLCATAHHLGDQIESLLMSFLRGSDYKIMSGIPERRELFVRPLLPFSKKEIQNYLDREGIAYSIDISNLTNDYTRNRFRNEVIPILEDINPSLTEHLINQKNWYDLQLSMLNRVLDDYIARHKKVIGDNFELDFTAFEKAYGKNMIPILLGKLLNDMQVHGGTFHHALQLSHAGTGKYVDTGIGKLYKTRTGVSFAKNTPPLIRSKKISLAQIQQSFELEWGKRKLQLSMMEDKNSIVYGRLNDFYLDLEMISFPIVLRSWQQGDKMKPLGMQGKKKLSDIFVDEKRSMHAKFEAIVVEDQNSIICLSDFRIADDVKITDQTKQILNIKIDF